MIRKVITIIILISVVKILISCCTEKIIFTKIDFRAVKYDTYWREVDTFDKNIAFEIYLYQDRIAFLKSLNSDLYATSCGQDYQNKMDTTTIELKADKQIILGQDTIKANDNLWTNSLVKKYIKLTEDDINPDFTWILQIKDEGIKMMKFESDKYNFQFSVKMTDSKIISDSASVYIKI